MGGGARDFRGDGRTPPEVNAALVEFGHEIVSHGWRWIDYHHVDEETERRHIRQALSAITALTGARPIGWMVGRARTPAADLRAARAR